MLLPKALFLFIALTLWIYLLVNERQAKGKVPLWARYAASTLALLALVGLLFPMTYTGGYDGDTATTELAIFTNGTPRSTLATPKGTAHRVTTDPMISRRYRLPLIHDWTSFVENHAHQPVSIHGFGLTTNQLKQLQAGKLTYHRPPVPQGIISCEWPQQLQESATLVVQGQYHHTSARETKLVLLSASVAVDSTSLTEPGTHAFTLRHQPTQRGNSVFELIAIRDGDTLQTEKIPVSISAPQRLNIFMLAASPSFEHRFLANWFEGLHYQIASRARVSQDRFSVRTNDAIGLSAIADPLNRSMFNQVDLLVADEAELSALRQREQQLILGAVAEGMGLLLLKGADGKRSLPGSSFRILDAGSTASQPVAVKAIDGATFPALVMPSVVSIQPNEAQQPLAYIDGNTIAATQLYGKGRITATTLTGTYGWWLKNQQTAYTQLWSLLIDHTVVSSRPRLRYVQTPRFPTTYSWIQLALQQDAATSASIDGQRYPMLQHEFLAPFHQVSFWLPQAGWHTVQSQPSTDSASFYVYGPGDWLAARAYAAMHMNGAFCKAHPFRPENTAAGLPEASGKELPKWLFFLVFLLSASVLWYDSRHYNQNVM